MEMSGLIGILISVAAPSAATVRPSPIPIQIVGAPQEKTARKLDAAVRGRFATDPRFVVTNNPSPDGLILAMPEGIGWERRLEWTEIHFQARISLPSGRTQVVAGYCYNWNLRACGKLLADAAAKFAAE
jgi:hypothetical protein